MLMRYETQKLLEVYKEHGKIIVGLDFDDTVFPLVDNEYIRERCDNVIEAVKLVSEYAVICLYTAASDQEIKYKQYILARLGITAHYTNDSPVKFGNSRKPYFNILLDDKAGLNEALEILKEFIKHKNK